MGLVTEQGPQRKSEYEGTDNVVTFRQTDFKMTLGHSAGIIQLEKNMSLELNSTT